MNITYKLWIEKDSKAVFGKGIYQLLMLVHTTGSLHKAAESVNMSYRAAWGKIREFENILNVDLLQKGRHGRTGARLTDAGTQMLRIFEQITTQIDGLIQHGPVKDLMDSMNAYIQQNTLTKPAAKGLKEK